MGLCWKIESNSWNQRLSKSQQFIPSLCLLTGQAFMRWQPSLSVGFPDLPIQWLLKSHIFILKPLPVEDSAANQKVFHIGVKECNCMGKSFRFSILLEFSGREKRKPPAILLFAKHVITPLFFESDLHGGKTPSFLLDQNEEGCGPKNCSANTWKQNWETGKPLPVNIVWALAWPVPELILPLAPQLCEPETFTSCLKCFGLSFLLQNKES